MNSFSIKNNTNKRKVIYIAKAELSDNKCKDTLYIMNEDISDIKAIDLGVVNTKYLIDTFNKSNLIKVCDNNTVKGDIVLNIFGYWYKLVKNSTLESELIKYMKLIRPNETIYIDYTGDQYINNININ